MLLPSTPVEEVSVDYVEPYVPTPVLSARDVMWTPTAAMLDVTSMLDMCERRLKSARRAFDMRGYLIVGSVLDKIAHGIDAGTQPLPQARDTLQRVLDKIGEKIRACPDG